MSASERMTNWDCPRKGQAMSSVPEFASQNENRLLARLQGAEYARIRPHLQPVDLEFKKQLYRTREPIETVYFVSRGVASAVAYDGDGSAIEVATIGDEGMVGITALFSDVTAANEVIMQVPGHGLQMSAADLRRLAPSGTQFYDLLTK